MTKFNSRQLLSFYAVIICDNVNKKSKQIILHTRTPHKLWPSVGRRPLGVPKNRFLVLAYDVRGVFVQNFMLLVATVWPVRCSWTSFYIYRYLFVFKNPKKTFKNQGGFHENSVISINSRTLHWTFWKH